MIDEDDAMNWALFGPVGIFGLFILIFLMYSACENKEECSKMKCEHGTPTLISHQCLCVEKPK